MAKKASFKLDSAPGHLLRRAQQFAYDLYMNEVGRDGLTPRQFTVLHAVQQDEGLSQTDLVRKTGIDRSTLADMISRLLKKGLLARERTKTDQRANSVRITAAGKKALSSALPKVTSAEDQILKAVSPKLRSDFVKALSEIAAKMDAAEAPKPAAKPATRRTRTTRTTRTTTKARSTTGRTATTRKAAPKTVKKAPARKAAPKAKAAKKATRGRAKKK
jgi:DNA-binding MarR family transcriptional regulator